MAKRIDPKDRKLADAIKPLLDYCDWESQDPAYVFMFLAHAFAHSYTRSVRKGLWLALDEHHEAARRDVAEYEQREKAISAAESELRSQEFARTHGLLVRPLAEA